MLLSAWRGKKQIQTPLEAMKIDQLDQNLRRFYAEARTKTVDLPCWDFIIR